jgi:hypothetical protein
METGPVRESPRSEDGGEGSGTAGGRLALFPAEGVLVDRPDRRPRRGGIRVTGLEREPAQREALRSSGDARLEEGTLRVAHWGEIRWEHIEES